MEYEQRITIKFLANDGLGTDKIEEKLNSQALKMCTHFARRKSGLQK
jgi:hypothetical protein